MGGAEWVEGFQLSTFFITALCRLFSREYEDGVGRATLRSMISKWLLDRVLLLDN